MAWHFETIWHQRSLSQILKLWLGPTKSVFLIAGGNQFSNFPWFPDFLGFLLPSILECKGENLGFSTPIKVFFPGRPGGHWHDGISWNIIRIPRNSCVVMVVDKF